MESVQPKQDPEMIKSKKSIAHLECRKCKSIAPDWKVIIYGITTGMGNYLGIQCPNCEEIVRVNIPLNLYILSPIGVSQM